MNGLCLNLVEIPYHRKTQLGGNTCTVVNEVAGREFHIEM